MLRKGVYWLSVVIFVCTQFVFVLVGVALVVLGIFSDQSLMHQSGFVCVGFMLAAFMLVSMWFSVNAAERLKYHLGL